MKRSWKYLIIMTVIAVMLALGWYYYADIMWKITIALALGSMVMIMFPRWGK